MKKNIKDKKKAPLSFEKLSTLTNRYRYKLIETYSLNQLENLICSAPTYPIDERHRELFNDIMLIRYCKIRKKFKWTDENIKRIVKVSDEFLKAYEEGFTKAKFIIDELYEKEHDKNSFKNKYYIELILYPQVLFDDDKYNSKEWKLYNAITSYLKAEAFLYICIQYDPITKDEGDFRENTLVNKEYSWNIEGFGENELKDYYICYALHELYSHNNWAFSDIPKINNIRTEISISCDGVDF